MSEVPPPTFLRKSTDAEDGFAATSPTTATTSADTSDGSDFDGAVPGMVTRKEISASAAEFAEKHSLKDRRVSALGHIGLARARTIGSTYVYT